MYFLAGSPFALAQLVGTGGNRMSIEFSIFDHNHPREEKT